MELYENDTILNEVSIFTRILIIKKNRVMIKLKIYSFYKINK